jgi:hypothetical protein
LQRTNGGGTGFFDVIGGDANYSVSTSYTVTGLTHGTTYRFRYRAKNLVGWSDLSPIGYLEPATVPVAPVAPIYSSSTDSSIILTLSPSLDAIGSSITDYELQIDGGSLASSFSDTNYVYSTDGFTYKILASDYSLTAGTLYRF